ncbi:MAG: phenylalanine--tRNA ligase subunit beta [Liquorilactobacillus mali]|uniref:phenylalanine--tRNA ligase subunit beta n=1 Tax=Liquorilactobacillus mali TaxID=1618 RepID=UPI0039ECB088
MKVSTKWLKDYIDLDINPEELAEKIERTAVEVDSVSRLDKKLKKIVVGFTVEVRKHPESDHLNICKVDVGEDDLLQIVCGAPNIAANKKVIVALPNSRIAGNVKIKRSKMRGEVSEGMICSLQEIGFSDSVVPKAYADGIYFLPDNAKPGEPVYSYLGMDEDIIDLDVTPNRADMLSMRGTAHELAAIYDKKVNLKKPELKEDSTDNVSNYIQVTADKELAPTYLLRVIKDVHVKESPMWLQKRLWNAGIRPMNNVVDVTNYILLDYGQPLHSFDYQKIAGKRIEVRLAKPGETLQTLDEEERELLSSDIVIADNNGPIALAGTMGGLNSGISANSQIIALEAAVFNSSAIRKTARKHNLHSEAAMRFERGINRETVAEALDMAAQLIAELGNGKVVSGFAVGAQANVQSVVVTITTKKINDVLGTGLQDAEIKDIFERLGFGVEEKAGAFKVSVPARRWDISIPADLIEEVARIYGYDNLPATLPSGELTPGKYTYKQQVIRDTRSILEESGLMQAISYGLTSDKKAQRFMMEDAQPTKLDFPMSSDRTTIRMNLISGLLDDVAYNNARKVSDVMLYEQGRVFYRDANSDRPREVEHVAAAMTGLYSAQSWHDEKKQIDFYVAKGIVEHLLTKLGVTGISYEASQKHEEMHPGRTADIFVGNLFIGFIGEVHPNISKEYGIGRTYVFELDLQKIIDFNNELIVYQPVSKYPVITRDVALAVSKDIENADIINFIKAQSGKILSKVQLFDVYEGAKIGIEQKSLAYELTYSDSSKTLADDVVNADFEKVMSKLKEKFNVEIR